MSMSANRGEHSELLAFLRILHCGSVQVADKAGEPRQSWLKVSAIERPSEDRRRYIIRDDHVVVMDDASVEIATVSKADIKVIADALLAQIKAAEGASFSCEASDKAFHLLNLVGAKAASTVKADLFLEVISPVFQGEVLSLGFSVKSELGGLPTLLNAGATQFQYKVIDCTAAEALAVQEAAPRAPGKAYPGPMKLLPALVSSRAKVAFESVVDPVFEQNLKMIDTAFPRILADTLMHAYLAGDLALKDAVQAPALLEELSEALSLPRAMVERLVRHKVKELLRHSALGMNPGRQWDGQVEAHGGWIIVKESGDIVCFHLINDDDFRDYLLANTKFDTPSMSRHQAGYVYRQGADPEAKLRLSLQVRFF
jgi:HpaII restriction endonuclease